MPGHRKEDKEGPYHQWGNTGKKYRYQTGEKKSRETARAKATKQGLAAHAAGYEG